MTYCPESTTGLTVLVVNAARRNRLGARENKARRTGLPWQIEGRRRAATAAVVLALVAGLAPFDAIPSPQTARAAGPLTLRISTDESGAEGNGPSEAPRISGTGRYIVFASLASNLVPGDTNGEYDIFLRDRTDGTITLVSVPQAGGQSNGFSYYPAVSDDGRYVAFESSATNLVVGDTNAKSDIFVRDLQLLTTSRVSVDASGAQADGSSSSPELSPDGSVLAFHSSATNLVLGDTNGKTDAFVRDLVAGTISRVSVSSGGAQGDNSSFLDGMSADGRYIAMSSNASNLVASDTNLREDIFVHDRLIGTTTRVSVSSDGDEAAGGSDSAAISGDGRYVVFESVAANLVAGDTNAANDIFLHDRTTGAARRVSVDTGGAQADSGSFLPALSRDGNAVAFESRATNLVDGDTNNRTDVFIRRLDAGIIERVSVDSAGVEANGNSFVASASADGTLVTFESLATNLVAADMNAATDVFVRELGPPPAPTPDLPVMFVHGINGDFRQPGFPAVLPAIESQTQSSVDVFPYYQDRGSLVGGICTSEPLISPTGPNGGMPVNLESAGDICDSQGDLALNVTRLHHDIQILYFESGKRPVVLMGNSEGAAIIRGFLAYSAELQDNVATTMVDSVVFLQGAQAGSKPARDGLDGRQPERLIGEWAGGIDFQRPAVEDLASESDWYYWVNPPGNHVPDLPYFNVYGDMEIAQITCFLFWCNEDSLSQLGDGLIYPGVDDPHAVPTEGGARFLPNAALEVQQWQWQLHKKFLFDPAAAQGLGFLTAIELAALDPIFHGNFGNSLDEISTSDCADETQLTLDVALLRVTVGRVTETPYLCTP